MKSVAITVLTPCLCPQGSMYDGLADNYNNYGTTSRSSYYSKFQAGNGSWGYPVRSCVRSKRPGVLGSGLGFMAEQTCIGCREE